MTDLWDGTYENSPADTDTIGEGNEEFQTLKQAIRERMANDHEMVTTDGSGQVRHGLHKQGSARLYVSASAPTTLPNGTALGSNDIGRLWFKTSDATLWEYDAVTPWVQIKVDTAALIANAVTYAKLQQSAALSVLGRSASDVGDMAPITAASDGDVLRRSGTALGFGTVVTAGLADDAVTNGKLANMAVNTIKGRVTAGTGDPEDLSQASVQAIIGIDTATDLGGLSPSDTKLSSQKAVKNYADAIASGGSTLYAPKDHKSTDTTYGVGSATNYGHVKVDAVPTNGSSNAAGSDGVFDALGLKAPLASPTLTGVPAAPTATTGTNTTQLATTAFVKTELTTLNADNLTSGTIPKARYDLQYRINTYTGNNLFNTLLPTFPTYPSAIIPISGVIFLSPTLYCVGSMQRTSATTININCMTPSGSLSTIAASSGDSTLHTVAIQYFES